MVMKWVKLWRAETGSFAQLPLVARALFGEILKLADENGRVHLGGREPWQAVAFALGADRSDRRALRKHIPLLLEDGCLVHEDGCLVFPGWGRFQDGEPRSSRDSATKRPPQSLDSTTTEPPSDRDSTTTEPRRSHDRVTTGSRPGHDEHRKCPESHSRALRREEKRKDPPVVPPRGTRREALSSLQGLPDPSSPDLTCSSEHYVALAWREASRRRGVMLTPSALSRERTRLQELERLALELAPAVAESRGWSTERAFCELVTRAFDAHAKAADAAEEARAEGRPAREVAWRLGWVVSRWEQYTRGAVAEEAA